MPAPTWEPAPGYSLPMTEAASLPAAYRPSSAAPSRPTTWACVLIRIP
ncbi:hypothetical protein ACFFX0_11210 [Citricoccus parietis]|uniref:Uncharacterized protein n=1 Tax=Citricoccus parietis TaxID=592307 RepID=A0ABV5FYI2_9MICC